ncbi:uncharacterized protein LOC142322330 [Lycorma delicatula]|uniref:uncharacterized protein LOC142322330 n=1 Tax=Lycorma delicatula TaxID=130591 RepID=UPI003F519D85
MTVQAPSWLTEGFIKTALERDEDTKNILSFENMVVNTPIPRGNNETCLIYGVKGDYKLKDEKEIKKISLIIKVPTKSGWHKFLLDKGLYKKENLLYNILIPKYKSMFGDKWPDMVPKSYHSTEEDVVILEDLKVKNYEMVSRVEQLGYDECVLALSNLAIFHAASIKLYETEPEFIKKVGDEMMFCNDMKDCFGGLTKSLVDKAADEYEKRPDLQKYVKPLRKIADISFDTITELFKQKKDEFNVLNHGDFWTTNMMFKYSDNKPVHIKLIDLQVSRYASPTCDLIYFFYGSVKEEVRSERFDELLNLYIDQLNKYLEIYGSEKRLSKKELLKVLDDRAIYAINISVSYLPFFLADPNKLEIVKMQEMSLEEFNNMGHDGTVSGYFENEKYFEIAKKRMEEFEKLGYFSRYQ